MNPSYRTRIGKMLNIRKTALAIATGVGLFLPTITANAQDTALDREGIEEIVREYLLENPEIMLEMQQALEAKQEALQLARQQETLKNERERLYNSPHQMVMGNPDAPITVIEFFDYNCGFCRRALADMERILAENEDVRFIMKEYPVLGEASVAAHRVSLAVIRNYPELYDPFHRELLEHEGRKDGDVALEIAARLGADQAKIEADLDNPQTMAALVEAYELAEGLGITGTPSYVVGETVVFGAVGYDRLMPLIKPEDSE